MIRYGAYRPRPGEAITWFTTSRDLAPGAYDYKTEAGSGPDVRIAESVGALIMAAYDWIQESEAAFEAEVRDRDTGRAGRGDGDIADQMMDQLVARLTRDSRIWVDEPDWLDRLKPASPAA